jgi:cystathionine beta-lyase/cystathionine gamma-synthase
MYPADTADDYAHLGFATRAIHAGQAPEPTTGAVIVPIYQTSTYAQPALGQHAGYDYSRTDNPTRSALQIALAALEGGSHGLVFASGMAATTTLLLLFKAGDHVIVGDDVYGGTYRLFHRILENFGLEFSFVNTTDANAVAAALRPTTRLIWLETPTNPLLKVVDIECIANLARSVGEHRPYVVVDNTFASPYLQQPLAHGADVVMHSTTKYLGGHSDVVGGALVTSDDDLYARLKFTQNAAGAVPGPFDTWLTLRGLKTLALRMQAHSANGLAVAQFLQQHPKVRHVIYPGLPDHPNYDVAARQMPRGFGGMLSCELHGGDEAAQALVERTKLFTLAESLGGVESLIEVPAVMTHASVAGSALEVPAGLVRLSVGIEDLADLLADLDQALAGV